MNFTSQFIKRKLAYRLDGEKEENMNCENCIYYSNLLHTCEFSGPEEQAPCEQEYEYTMEDLGYDWW